MNQRVLATLSKILTEEGLFQFDACTLFVHHTFLQFVHLNVPFLSFLSTVWKNQNFIFKNILGVLFHNLHTVHYQLTKVNVALLAA